MAPTDYFLKIDTIEGESDAKGFRKQLHIESFSFGATNNGSAVHPGHVSLQDFHFVIQNGRASAQLFDACVRGRRIRQAMLSCRQAGGDRNPYTYLKVTFGDIFVSSFHTGGSGQQVPPMEQVSFNFTNVTFEYFEQKPDGTVALTNTTGYDLKEVDGRAKAT
jgi:type VI secretion system secreted protein Hcp